MKSSHPISDYALLIFLAAIFGSNFMVTKISLVEASPYFVVFFRLLVASLILTGLMVLAGQRLPTGRVWIPIIGCGIFGHTLPFTLLSWGQERVDAGLAAILMATMPLFTLLLAQIFTRDEKPNRYSVSGFALALVGIAVLFGFDKLASLGDETLRQYAVASAAMCYGVNAIITKQLVGLAWQQMTACMMMAALVLSLPALVFSDTLVSQLSSETWFAIFYTGVMPTALGAVLVLVIVSRSGASFLSQINFLVPLFGVGFAMLFLGEAMPQNGYIALMLIFAGIALSRKRPVYSPQPDHTGG